MVNMWAIAHARSAGCRRRRHGEIAGRLWKVISTRKAGKKLENVESSQSMAYSCPARMVRARAGLVSLQVEREREAGCYCCCRLISHEEIAGRRWKQSARKAGRKLENVEGEASSQGRAYIAGRRVRADDGGARRLCK